MRIMFAAGGTAGHVNPALSVAQEIKKRHPEAEIMFVGTADKIESALVPKAGYGFASIDVTGFQRSLAPADIVYNLGTVRRLLTVTGKCKKIISDFNPDVVAGFGGYVSGPVVRAAHKMGIKTAIHEQNAFPGKTNIALSKYADRVMVTDPAASERMKSANTVTTGMPVRDEILEADFFEARKKLGISENRIMVLSTGGSLGSQAINECMLGVFAEMKDSGVFFVHGYGSAAKDYFPAALKKAGLDGNENIRADEYIYNMGDCMAAADFIVSRAGAGAVAELEALGRPALLIPYPYAAENHQYHNALTLKNAGAAFLTEQKDLNAADVAKLIRSLADEPAIFAEMGRKAAEHSKRDAKQAICDEILSLIAGAEG